MVSRKSLKTGGRQKGTPNKRTQDLKEKAAEIGVCPFTILLLYAKRDWKALGFSSEVIVRAGKNGESYEEDRITAKMQLDAASEACQYLESKRKAVEHVVDQENPIGVNLGVTKEVVDILSEFKYLIGKVHQE